MKDYSTVSHGEIYEIKSIASTKWATAKAVLTASPLIVCIDDNSVDTMNQAMVFQKQDLPAYEQSAIQKRFYPDFKSLIRGEHPELKIWRVNIRRTGCCIDFFNYANPHVGRRSATDLTCFIPYRDSGSIEFAVADNIELAPFDIRRIKLSYEEIDQKHELRSSVDFWTGEQEFNDVFISRDL